MISFFSFLTTPELAIITVPAAATYDNMRLYHEPTVVPKSLINTIHAIVWFDCRRDTTHSVTHNAINALLYYQVPL